jgi:hypothetical protein
MLVLQRIRWGAEVSAHSEQESFFDGINRG